MAFRNRGNPFWMTATWNHWSVLWMLVVVVVLLLLLLLLVVTDTGTWFSRNNCTAATAGFKATFLNVKGGPRKGAGHRTS